MTQLETPQIEIKENRDNYAQVVVEPLDPGFGTTLGNMGDDAVVVEAYVDANGRVEDYRILSQPDDAQAVLPQLKNLLIFTTFRPALSMGRPTAGTAVLSFSKVSVKG